MDNSHIISVMATSHSQRSSSILRIREKATIACKKIDYNLISRFKFKVRFRTKLKMYKPPGLSFQLGIHSSKITYKHKVFKFVWWENIVYLKLVLSFSRGDFARIWLFHFPYCHCRPWSSIGER